MEKLRILGIDYEVIRKPMDCCNSSGAVHNSKNIITVCSEANSPEHGKAVLLHEVIEALNYRLELKLDHSVITALESGLFSVFRDNPGFLEAT